MLTTPIIIFIVLAFLGLIDTIYIAKHTRKDDPLVCPIGFECNAVVNSNYSTFFGFKNDILGILFYLGMLTVAATSVFFPGYEYEVYLVLKISTLGAALFSIYLTYVQAFKLKNFCLYCLASAGISIGLFITSFFL